MQASQGEVGTGLATTAPARKGALCSPRNAYARRPAAAGEEKAGRQAHAGRLRRELPLTYTTTSEARGMRAVDPTADVRRMSEIFILDVYTRLSEITLYKDRRKRSTASVSVVEGTLDPDFRGGVYKCATFAHMWLRAVGGVRSGLCTAPPGSL